MQPVPEGAARLYGRTAFSFDVVEAPQRYEFFASSSVPGALVPYRTPSGDPGRFAI